MYRGENNRTRSPLLGSPSYNYRILVLQLQDSIITSVVTADFDCMQFPSRAKAFNFSFFYSCNFLVVGLVGCGDLRRFIAINRWIILLKSGNNHPCSSRNVDSYFSAVYGYTSLKTKPISEASCILVVNCKTLTLTNEV